MEDKTHVTVSKAPEFMTFDREQFDPERVDGQRMTNEPPLRSLFSLLPEQVDELRAEMRRDGQWMREQLSTRCGS